MDETGRRVLATQSKLDRNTAQRKGKPSNKGKQCPREIWETKQVTNSKTKRTRRGHIGIKSEMSTTPKLRGTTKERGVKSNGRKGKLKTKRKILNAVKKAAIQSIRSTKIEKDNTKRNEQKSKRLSSDRQTAKRNKIQRQPARTGKHQNVKKKMTAYNRERLSTTKQTVKKVTINRAKKEKIKIPKAKPEHLRVNTGVKKTNDGKTTQRRKEQTNSQSNKEKHSIRHFYFEEINSFKINEPGMSNPHSICPVSNDKAWIALNFSNIIYLFNKSGVLEKTLKMPGNVDDMALRPDGGLLVTSFGSGVVWSVDKTFKKIKTEKSFEIAPFICRGINCLESEVVICCVNSMGLSKAHDDDKRIVMKLSSRGQLIKEYTRLADDGEFRHPYRIALNVNGDVLVIDHGRGQLIVMGADGKEKCRYPAEQQLSHSSLYGVTCNTDGYIFVADNRRRCIDVLYPDGSYCQTLIKKTGSLNNIKMDNVGDLWIGCLDEPHIKIIRVSKRTF